MRNILTNKILVSIQDLTLKNSIIIIALTVLKQNDIAANIPCVFIMLSFYNLTINLRMFLCLSIIKCFFSLGVHFQLHLS